MTTDAVPITAQSAKRAVVQVGGGRGFIVGVGDERYIITAAHCLPLAQLPRPHLANSSTELAFKGIVGRLSSKGQTIWAELCAFSLTDDIAVFAAPDDQNLPDQNERYGRFTRWAKMIGIGRPPVAIAAYKWESTPGTPPWVLSLDGEWRSCVAHSTGRFLSITGEPGIIKSGMSGSPIIDAYGAAIGLVSTGSDSHNIHPSLMDCLSLWLLRKFDNRCVDQEVSSGLAPASAVPNAGP
jgi:hypothetical protein